MYDMKGEEISDLYERVAKLEEALEGLAAGQCCETPGCCTDDPLCDTMIARQALLP